MKFIGRAAFAAAFLAAPAAAQIGIEGNLAEVDGEFGGELGVTYDLFDSAGFTLRSGAGAFIFDEEDSDAGNRVCRETVDGNLVGSSDCDGTSVNAYGRLELTYDLPILSVGGGLRLGDELNPYVTLAGSLAPFVKLKANLGDDYYAGGITVGF